MKSLKKNAIFNILYDASNIIFPLITSMYVARVILPSGVGQVSYAQNIASYFVTFAALGLPTYGLREIAKVHDDKKLADKTFTELFLINAISTSLAAIAYFILIFSPLGNNFDKKLAVCFGFSIIFNYLNIDWLYKGKEEYVFIALRSVFIKIISLIATFVFVKTKEDYLKYGIIVVVALGGNYIFNALHARKLISFNFEGIEFKKHLKPLFIFLLSIFFTSIYSKLDITMLGSMSSETATGLYTNAHKICDMIMIACSSLSAVFLPRLSYYYGKEPEEFKKLLDKGVRILAFISVPACVGLFVIAPKAMELFFGKEFVAGAVTVRILSVLIIVKSFGNLLCYQLVVCTGNERKMIPAYAIGSVANIILNAILIPSLAQNGAAYASVASEILLNLYQFIMIRKLITIPISKKALFQSALSSAAMGLLVFLLSKITLPLILSVAISVAGGFAFYIIINLIMKNEFIIEALNTVKQKIKK